MKKRYWYIVGSICIILIILGIVFFEYIADYFFGNEDSNPKGKLLTTYLTVVGGIGAIVVLYQAYQRITLQTEQNRITIDNGNDKRFGDAIGYLSNNNTGIAIGAVHILNQLAKEDKRYIPIVANLYLDILSESSTPNLNDRKVKLIFESIFTDIFDTQRVVFNGLVFREVLFDTIKNKVFQNCTFEGHSSIHYALDSDFIDCFFNKVLFMNVDTLRIMNSNIDNCLFSNHSDDLEGLLMYKCKVANCRVDSIKCINMLSLEDCNLKGTLHIASPKVINANINVDMEELITIATYNLRGVNPNNDMIITSYKDYDISKRK